MVYTDYEKAFDSVNHDRLIQKLESFGVMGSLLNWFSSYLNNRTLSVRINDSVFYPFLMSSGVPQGSHLGLLLFIIFINDIHLVITSSKFLLFADDVKIFHHINSPRDSELLQNDLNSIQSWSILNGLHLNILNAQLYLLLGLKIPFTTIIS